MLRISLNNSDQLAAVLKVPDLIPLSLLPPGISALVSELSGCKESIHRLHELGLRGGTQVEMVQPGSPCIIRLGGSKLCFRTNELMSVLVQPTASIACLTT